MRTLVLSVMLVLAALQFAAAEPAWVPFSPPDGAFTVSVPSTPALMQENENTTMWIAGLKGEYVYMLGFGKLAGLKEQTPDLRAKAVDVFTDAMLQGAKIETRSRKKVGDGYEVEGVNARGNTSYVRVLPSFDTDRIYVQVAIGQVDLKTFYGSLKVK